MKQPRRRWVSFESRSQPLISRRAFARRLARNFAASALLVVVSLLVGMSGYHWLEDMPWIDAFVNAAMILSGMGPLGPLQTWGGKLFAGLYALYSGLAVIIAAGGDAGADNPPCHSPLPPANRPGEVSP